MTRERWEAASTIVGAFCALVMLLAMLSGLAALLSLLAGVVWHLPYTVAWLAACSVLTIGLTGAVAVFEAREGATLPIFGFGVAFTLLSTLCVWVAQ